MIGFFFLALSLAVIVVVTVGMDRTIIDGHDKASRLVAGTGVILLIAILIFYSYLGRFVDMKTADYIHSHQADLMRVRQYINQDPQKVIEQISNYTKAHPQDDNPKVILFKLYIGTGAYKKARVILSTLRHKTKNTQSILDLQVKLVMNEQVANDTIRLVSLERLRKKGANAQLVQYYIGWIAYRSGNLHKAISLWQEVLSQIVPGSENYKALSAKIVMARDALNQISS